MTPHGAPPPSYVRPMVTVTVTGGVTGDAAASGRRQRYCATQVPSPAEVSPSGLGRTLGKRVGGNPSRVQIP